MMVNRRNKVKRKFHFSFSFSFFESNDKQGGDGHCKTFFSKMKGDRNKKFKPNFFFLGSFVYNLLLRQQQAATLCMTDVAENNKSHPRSAQHQRFSVD